MAQARKALDTFHTGTARTALARVDTTWLGDGEKAELAELRERLELLKAETDELAARGDQVVEKHGPRPARSSRARSGCLAKGTSRARGRPGGDGAQFGAITPVFSVPRDESSIQPMGPQEGVVGEHVYSGRVRNHYPPIQYHRPAAKRLSEAQVVRHDELRDCEATENLEEFLSARRIEVRCRLVEDDDFRLHGQHTGNRHPPLLTKGEVVGRPVRQIGYLDSSQRPLHTLLQLFALDAEVLGPERDVLGHRRHEELVVGVLKDNPHTAPDLHHRVGP